MSYDTDVVMLHHWLRILVIFVLSDDRIAYLMYPVTYYKLHKNHNSIRSFFVLNESLTQSLTALARCLVATHQTQKWRESRFKPLKKTEGSYL